MTQLHGVARTALALAIFAMGGQAQTTIAETNLAPDGSEGTAAKDVASNGAKASNSLESFLKRTVSFTGSLRIRLESTQGSDFSLTTANAYTLTRARLGLAFQPVSWLRVFGEAADARAEFYKTTPPSTVDDPFDLRQGYVEAGSLEGNGVRLRVGREDMTLGSGRLVAVSLWSNDGKTFDVARGTFTSGFANMEVIAGSPVLIDPTRFDRHKPGEHFYVAYSTLKKIVPGGSVEPYFMAKTQDGTDAVKSKDGHLGDADTLYAGARLIGKLPGRFDYSVEGVREAGHYSDDVVDAWGYAAGGGWTVNGSDWKPHISSDYVWGSGDDGKKDGFHQAFDYLYGLNQPLNSMTAQFSWKNIEDWRAGVDFLPVKKLMVKVDFRDYWLATVQDGLYNSSGTRTVLDAKATSNHVGEGVDAQLILTLNSKTVVGFGFGNVAPGAYLRQAGKTTGFVYPSIYVTRQL
ncbi:MAG: alginate export family protein [Bryobacteraceae bacterium]